MVTESGLYRSRGNAIGSIPGRPAIAACVGIASWKRQAIQARELQKKVDERDKEIARLKSKLKDAESALRKISGPFLNWSGKAERLSFDVPTLPLFVHERLGITSPAPRAPHSPPANTARSPSR